MSEEKKEYPCPQCGEKLEQIKVVASGDRGAHGELNYTAADAERGFWLGRFPVNGVIHAKMCPGCHYILFYGKPNRGGA